MASVLFALAATSVSVILIVFLAIRFFDARYRCSHCAKRLPKLRAFMVQCPYCYHDPFPIEGVDYGERYKLDEVPRALLPPYQQPIKRSGVR